jgi:effector-binding domain-containing protein
MKNLKIAALFLGTLFLYQCGGETESEESEEKAPETEVTTETDTATETTTEETTVNYTVGIEQTTLEPQMMLAIKDSTDFASYAATIGPLFQAVFVAAGDKVAGMPSTIYNSWNPEGMFSITAGVAISGDVEPGENMEVLDMYAGNVVKAIHMGSYDNLGETHANLEKYMEENNLEANGSRWETYVSDPGTTAPDSVLTHIFQPVK